jgi:hypothetical protein
LDRSGCVHDSSLTTSFVIIAGREGEAVGDFKDTIDIKTEKLSCNIDRI